MTTCSPPANVAPPPPPPAPKKSTRSRLLKFPSFGRAHSSSKKSSGELSPSSISSSAAGGRSDASSRAAATTTTTSSTSSYSSTSSSIPFTRPQIWFTKPDSHHQSTPIVQIDLVEDEGRGDSPSAAQSDRYSTHVTNKGTKCQQRLTVNPRPVHPPRRGSLFITSSAEEQIVTPFAQILATLRKVRGNFTTLTRLGPAAETAHSNHLHSPGSHRWKEKKRSKGSDTLQDRTLAIETLRDLEWCLEQLETIQTHRSVSDMATSKFKKLLNKELNSQYADEGKSGIQISQYIKSTFFDHDGNSGELKSDEDSTNGGLQDIQEEECESYTQALDNKSSPSSKDPHSSHQGDQCFSQNSTKSSQNQSSLQISHSSHPSSSLHETCSTSRRHLGPGKGTADSSKTVRIEGDFVRSPSQQWEMALASLPTYGVECAAMDDLTKIMEDSLNFWGMDLFQVAQLTDNRSLSCIAFTLLKNRGLLAKFEIDPHVFLRYIQRVEENYYKHIPYHNSIHAADVTQSMHVLLSAKAWENVFNELEIFAALFSCAIHDVNHPGVTNQYLVNTNDALAILYNDSSVLENHHLAVAFSLQKETGCDILSSLTKKQRLLFRRMVIDMVLATDMSKHMSLLADLKTMVETKTVSGSVVLNLDNYNDRIQILQSMVHCADLSNPTKPLSLYREWTSRIMEEFFLQGDKERARGLDISPMCDRETASIEKTQVSFIDFIALPLWETWADLVYPDAQEIFDTLQANRDWYSSHIDDKSNKNSTTS